MNKKILLTMICIIAIVFGTVAYATSDLTPSTSADNLRETPLVGTNTTDPNEGIMPINADEDEEFNNAIQSEGIPEDWARDVSSDMWRGDAGNAIQSDVFESSDYVSASTQIIDGNAFYAGRDVQLDNIEIYGDLFVAGQNVSLNKVNVTGNIYGAGEIVTVAESDVSGNVFLAGGTLTIKNTAVQDAFVAGETLTFDEETYISRTLYAGGNNLTLNGISVGRNATVSAENLELSKDVVVQGILNYTAKVAEIPEGVTIGKMIAGEYQEDEVELRSPVETAINHIVTVVVKAILICGFVVLFAKGFIEKQKVDKPIGYFAKNFGKGFVLMIALPMLALALMCTGVGVGLGFMVMAIYCIIFAIATSLVSVAISANITKKSECSALKFYGITILVALVIGVLGSIPVVGVFISGIIGLIGMGLVFSSLKNKKAKKEEVIEEA